MHIIIYVHDSLRHDYVHTISPSTTTDTPGFDALAADGVIFTHAFAQTTWSKASGASLLTGYYPRALGAGSKNNQMPPRAFSVLNQLQEKGFKRIAISANSFISEKFGFEAGFDYIPYVYDMEAFQRRPRKSKGTPDRNRLRGNPYILTDDLNALYFDYLDQAQPQDVFGLIWSMDTHLPYFDRYEIEHYYSGLEVVTYNQVASTPVETIKALYTKMVQYADDKFGEFVDTLKQRGLYDDALIITIGDHGESFGEHGQMMHSGIPYDQMTRVPLIVKFPHNWQAGHTCHHLVELVDLLPTIASYLQLDVQYPHPVHGKNLIPLVEGKDKLRDWIYSEFEISSTNFVSTLRGKKYQYICEFFQQDENHHGKKDTIKQLFNWIRINFNLGKLEELYDLKTDPHATNNVIGKASYSTVEQDYKQSLRSLIQSLEAATNIWGRMTQAEIDDVLEKRLMDLGYID